MTKTRGEKARELQNKYGWATSRLATKMIPVIRESYDDIELIDLLMALPVKFEFVEVDPSKFKEGTTMRDYAIGGYITRDTERGNPDRLIVHLTLSKPEEMTWDDFFTAIIERDPAHYTAMAAFIYLHEALHILMRHYDYYLNRDYRALVQTYNPELPEESINRLLNIAFDYWINGYLITQASSTSVIRSIGTSENFNGLYNPNLVPGILEQQEIVIKIAKEAEVETQEITDDAGEVVADTISVTIDGRTSTTIIWREGHQPDHGENTRSEQARNTSGAQTQDISDVLSTTRNNILDKTRGKEGQGTLSKLGVDYAVPIDWFSHLKNSIFSVIQKYSTTSEPTWSKLKNKYRHIAPMPGRIYKEPRLAAIVSIDQSGSMSDQDLEKINYVVTQLSKKTEFIEVLLHDHEVAEKRTFTSKNPLAIRDFITNRVACGGTSHSEVFQTIAEIKKKHPKKKFVYLSFSDNWSDIEDVYDDQIFDKIISYWITTDENRTVNVPGMQISLENGLLRR